MPFTFAHPAAAMPLHRPLGRYGVVSALVIGSLSPDLTYFLPFAIARSDSHSLIGLVWFCLPVTLVSYLLFHLLLKGPLLGLLPGFALRRLGAHTSSFRSLPSSSWTPVVVSSLAGATTHIFWDSFTHQTGSAVTLLPLLRVYLFEFAGYPIHAYKLLWHGSTGVGLALLGWWILKWFKRTAERPASLPVVLSPAQRLLIITAIACFPVAAGLRAGVQSLGTLGGVTALKTFVTTAVLSSLPVFAFSLLMYGASWHAWRVRKAD
jgi:Domain of unknown function (DUF4184)